MEKMERVPRHVAVDSDAGTFAQYDLAGVQPGTVMVVTTANDKHELRKIEDSTPLEDWDYDGNEVDVTLFRGGFRTPSVVMRTGMEVYAAPKNSSIQHSLGVVAEIAVRMDGESVVK